MNIKEVNMKYDLTVVGGGTAGCACAYIAGKLGLKVLLIEKLSYLGGAMTSSLVIPAMKTSSNAINTEFYNTLYENLYNLGGAITYSDGNKGWFNPELLKIVLDRMMTEANVKVIYESDIIKIKKKLSSYSATIYDDNLSFDRKLLSSHIETTYIVDGTGDAKICKKLNYKFFVNKNNFQPINLRFIMSGINSKKFCDWIMNLDKNRDVTTCACIDDKWYVSTAYTWDNNIDWALKSVVTDAINDGVLKEEDINYFQLFSVAGTPDSIAFNCPRILNREI